MVDETYGLEQPQEQVSIAPETPVEPQVSVSEPGLVLPISQQAAVNRANRFSIGLPKSSIDNQKALNLILQQRERDLRDQASTELDFQKTVDTNQVVQDIIAKQSKEGPLSLPQQLMIKDLVNRKATNPNTVIEENYAEQFMQKLKQTATDNPNGALAESLKSLPNYTKAITESGKDLKAKYERIQTLTEEAEAAYKNQSWIGWGADKLKELTTVYQQAKLRGLVTGGLSTYSKDYLSENVEAQWQDLMFRPFDEFDSQVTTITKKLIEDNPSLALFWLSASQGLSSEQRLLTNMAPLLDFGLATDLVGAGFKTAQLLRLRGVANRATQTIIDHAEQTVSRAAVAEAAGDLRGASVEQFSNEVLRGPSEKQVTDTLSDMAGIFETKTAPLEEMGVPGINGNMRQEFVNRLRESMNTVFGNFRERVQNMMKIEQIPAIAAVPKLANMLAETLQKNYPGLANTIVKNNLFRDTTTGQWFYEATIANSKGTGFASEKVARSFVNANRLGEVEIKEIYGPGKSIEVATAGTKTLSEADAKALFQFELEANKLFKGQFPRPAPGEWDKDFIASTANPGNIQVKQQGASFYIVKTQPIPLNANYVRDLLLKTAETQSSNKILNAAVGGLMGKLRTPEETLAVENMINRKLAVYSANKYYEVFKDTMKDINKLGGWKLPFTANKQKWREWNDFISILDNVPNATTGKKGVAEAFDTPGELRDLYLQYKGRPPDEQEVAASFAYRSQEIIRQQIARLNKLKNQYREGAQNWTLTGLENFASETKTIAGVHKTTSFNGVREYELPTSENATVLFMHRGELGVDSIYNTTLRNGARLAGSKLEANVREDIASGKLKVVRLVEPDEQPLRSMYNPGAIVDGHSVADLRITHVVSAALEDRVISINDIKVNPLPKHDYDHYVVQPVIKYNPVTKMHEYLGDRTIAGFNVKAMGIQIAEGLDKIRNFVKNGEYTAAMNYHSASKLPMNYSDIEQWFKPTLSMEGWDDPARLNLDHTIRVVPNGKLSIELDKNLERHFEGVKEATGAGFKDWTRETFGQVNVHDPYDIFTANNTGTKANPIWDVAPTKFIDPIVSINRGLTRAINDINLNDYKVTSIEHWIQEAKDLLDFSDSQIAAAPAWVFHQAGVSPSAWKQGLSGVEAMKQQNLINAQMQIKQFLGVKDVNTTFIHNAAQILADSVYERIGQGKTLLALDHMLPYLKDPFEYARAMTFHAKVGLFAVPQLLVQASTFTAIGGIAGWDKAAMGTHATLLHTWARINRNPEIIEFFDKKASAFGFKTGEFKEAFDILSSTGFEIPGREHIWRDNTGYFDFIKGPTGTFLNAGSWFFTEGERTARTGAFYTAYREFRELNPTRKITDTDKRWMLNRADLLNQNMSRASASNIQKGIWSLPTQFLSFPIRQAELMIGTRLTGIEKARLFGTYALFYGIPTALGAFTMGVGGDLMKSSLASGGYVPTAKDNTYLDKIATQGLPAFLIYAMTGNLYNIGERYAGGSSPIIDSLRSDKSFWEILGGASGSTVYKSIAGMDGLATAVMSAAKGIDKFRFKPEDFIEPFKQITSVNSVDRLYQAIQTGKWFATSEQELGKVSPSDAAFMTLTGLSKQTTADLGTILWNREYEKKVQQGALQTFIKEFRRGLREFDANNSEQGHDYFKRAYRELIIKGYPKEDWSKAVAIATSGEESLVNRIILDYYTKKVPEERKDIGHEQMQKFLRSDLP